MLERLRAEEEAVEAASVVSDAAAALNRDAPGRPVLRNADTFGYNARSEVTSHNPTGYMALSYAYDAFGNLLDSSGPLRNLFRHRFSTKYLDSETGLYYYGYRYYSPVLMRWINRDPIEEGGGINLYAASENNLLNSWDMIGLWSATWVSRGEKRRV